MKDKDLWFADGAIDLDFKRQLRLEVIDIFEKSKRKNWFFRFFIPPVSIGLAVAIAFFVLQEPTNSYIADKNIPVLSNIAKQKELDRIDYELVTVEKELEADKDVASAINFE